MPFEPGVGASNGTFIRRSAAAKEAPPRAMDIDTEFRVVTVVYKVPPPGLDFGLDESMRVVYMEPSAFLGHLFCVNDQVLFVNGVSPGSPTEAMALMEKREGEIVVSVLRSEHVEPIPRDRSKLVNLERRRGYCYFVAKLKTTETNKKLGLSVRQVNNNIYVAQVANDGIAFGVLLPGDFILDVDGTRGHNMSVPALKKHITAKLMANGECSMIVERAENYDTRVMTLNALKLKPMPKKMDPDMPIDASTIGSKQAEFHYRNNRQTPVQANLKPCLKGAKLPEKEKEVKKAPKKPSPKKKEKKDNTTTVSKTVDSVTTTVDDETTGGGNKSKTTALTTCTAATTEVTTNTVTGGERTEETDQQPSSNGAVPAAPLNRKVSWSSNEPEVQLIAMDHEAGVPLQKVAERKRQNSTASSSNSSISSAPKSNAAGSKVTAPSKVNSARQKKSTNPPAAPATSPPKRGKTKPSPESRGRLNMAEKRCVTSQRRTPAASAKQKPNGVKRKKKK